MALIRCDAHRPVVENRYETAAHPFGHPNGAILCSFQDCESAGLVWLDPAERRAFDAGQRVFHGPTKLVRFRVEGPAGQAS